MDLNRSIKMALPEVSSWLKKQKEREDIEATVTMGVSTTIKTWLVTAAYRHSTHSTERRGATQRHMVGRQKGMLIRRWLARSCNMFEPSRLHSIRRLPLAPGKPTPMLDVSLRLTLRSFMAER